MGLDDLIDDDNDEDDGPQIDQGREALTGGGSVGSSSEMDDDWRHDYSGGSIDKEQAITIKKIVNNLSNRLKETNLDLTIEDGKVEGDVRYLALLFSYMTMDVSQAELEDLVKE